MEKKYEMLMDEANTLVLANGQRLYRIKALRDFGNVKAGDIGGYISKEENLYLEGNCWVYGNAKVCDDARVSGDAKVCDYVQVYGDAKVSGNAVVYGHARVYGHAIVYDNARVYGHAQVFGNAQVSGDTRVSGHAMVSGHAIVYGDAQVYDNARVYGNAKLCGKANIQSASDYLTIGPIGSRNDITTFYRNTGNSIEVCCGCFAGTIQEFEEAVKKTHKEEEYYIYDYMIVIKLVVSKFNRKEMTA